MKNFKEFWEGYKAWCKVGRDNKYGNMLMLILLPLIILLCLTYYFIGKEIAHQEDQIELINKELDGYENM